jgi:hypothetical protein
VLIEERIPASKIDKDVHARISKPHKIGWLDLQNLTVFIPPLFPHLDNHIAFLSRDAI